MKDKVELVHFRNDEYALCIKCKTCGAIGDPMSKNWNYDAVAQTWEPQVRHLPPCKHFEHERQSSVGVVAKFTGIVPKAI